MQLRARKRHRLITTASPTADGDVSNGHLQTAPDPTNKVAVNPLAFSADADGKYDPIARWQNLQRPEFDYFIFLGDTILRTVTARSAAAADPLTDPAQALADYRRKYQEDLRLPIQVDLTE
jgi:phosphodiesterase/alkaline phosphatase D-like protein